MKINCIVDTKKYQNISDFKEPVKSEKFLKQKKMLNRNASSRKFWAPRLKNENIAKNAGMQNVFAEYCCSVLLETMCVCVCLCAY